MCTRRSPKQLNGGSDATITSFYYDALNRVTRADDTDSRVDLKYNTLSLAESEEMRYGTENLGSTGKIVEFDYDDQGRMVKCRYPDATSSAGELVYTYDVLNRLSVLERVPVVLAALLAVGGAGFAAFELFIGSR